MDVLDLRSAAAGPVRSAAVVPVSAPDRAAWDAYVLAADDTSVYHLAGWLDVMASTFGLQAHYLFAREDGQVLGVLPLLEVKSLLAGHVLTSLPGGLHAATEEAAAALLAQARERLLARGAAYLILRDGLHRWEAPDLVTNDDHVTLVAQLPRETNDLGKSVKKRARQLANQAMKAGVQVVNGTATFGASYPVYARTMRDKGTPTLGARFFENVLAAFPDYFRFLTVCHEGRVLGGGFVTPFKDTVYCTWGGMLREFYDLRPNHLLYWETMRYGVAQGLDWVDFGRSLRDSGTYVFKQNWGAEPRPLYQQYFLNGPDLPPAVGGGREGAPAYDLATRLWSKLPVAIAEILGPQVRRRMPFG